MKNALAVAYLACLMTMKSCDDDNQFYRDLAYRYAPIHYQDTDESDPRADYITRVDYDGDWLGTNNWDNLQTGDLSAHIYYSVVETHTHWFIVYSFFHPRDWEDQDVIGSEHENDLEGVLSTIRKTGSQFGSLECLITVFHDDFFSFVPANSSLTNGNEDIDGTLSFENFENELHPKTCQEAKGHGVKAWPYAGDFYGESGTDGIIYFPSKTTASVPTSGNDRLVFYKLIDLNSFGNLWTMQILEANQGPNTSKTFAQWGTLKGDESGSCGDGLLNTCRENAANTPWGWDDHDDGASYRGEFAIDPAKLVNHYFDGLGNFSDRYVRNKYLEELKRQGYSDAVTPRGWPAALKPNSLYSRLD